MNSFHTEGRAESSCPGLLQAAYCLDGMLTRPLCCASTPGSVFLSTELYRWTVTLPKSNPASSKDDCRARHPRSLPGPGPLLRALCGQCQTRGWVLIPQAVFKHSRRLRLSTLSFSAKVGAMLKIKHYGFNGWGVKKHISFLVLFHHSVDTVKQFKLKFSLHLVFSKEKLPYRILKNWKLKKFQMKQVLFLPYIMKNFHYSDSIIISMIVVVL